MAAIKARLHLEWHNPAAIQRERQSGMNIDAEIEIGQDATLSRLILKFCTQEPAVNHAKNSKAKSRHLSCSRVREQYGCTVCLITGQRRYGRGIDQGQKRKKGIYHSYKERKRVTAAGWALSSWWNSYSEYRFSNKLFRLKYWTTHWETGSSQSPLLMSGCTT